MLLISAFSGSCATIMKTTESWPEPGIFRGVVEDAHLITSGKDETVGYLLPVNFVQWVVWEDPDA